MAVIKPRAAWSHEENLSFLAVWEEFSVRLRSQRRNANVYDTMILRLSNLGIEADRKIITNKIDNLIRRFKTEWRKGGSTGGQPSKWPYFNQVRQIIETSKNINLSLAEDKTVMLSIEPEPGPSTEDSNSNFLESSEPVEESIFNDNTLVGPEADEALVGTYHHPAKCARVDNTLLNTVNSLVEAAAMALEEEKEMRKEEREMLDKLTKATEEGVVIQQGILQLLKELVNSKQE